MIILTAAQADQVRGPTSPGAALEPVRLSDGTFALPETCATDPAHVMHHTLLQSLPARAVAADEYFRSDDEDSQ